jgi:hypothetical protein
MELATFIPAASTAGVIANLAAPGKTEPFSIKNNLNPYRSELYVIILAITLPFPSKEPVLQFAEQLNFWRPFPSTK